MCLIAPVPIYATESFDCILGLGSVVNYLEPSLTSIRRDEIKLHVTNMTRYNGAIQIKLLDHLALVTALSDLPEFRAVLDPCYDPVVQKGYAAIHDDAEVYLGDVVSGLKRRLRDYRQLEFVWEHYVHNEQKMPLHYRDNVFIKALDLSALALEMRVGQHPLGPYAVEKYKAIWTPEMDDIAHDVLRVLDIEQQWRLVDDAYKAGRDRLAEFINERKE